MAMQSIELELFEGPALRLWRANGVRAQVNNVVSQVLMFSPVNQRTLPDLRGKLDELLRETLAWWGRVNPSELDQTSDRVSEGLDVMNFAGLDGARLALRNAFYLAHAFLAEPRRTRAEAESVVRLLLERALDVLQEDAKLFDPPAG